MHTVVITESERERMMINEINKAVRRCKIGKVTRKTHIVPGQIKDMFRGPLPAQIYTPNTCFSA